MKIHLFSAVVLAFATSASYGQSQAVQWRVEDGGNGHWYALMPTPPGWPQAFQAAIEAGASLGSLETESERLWIANALPCSTGYLGGRQVRGSEAPDSGWHWLTGAPVTAPLVCDDNPCGANSPIEDGEQDFLHFYSESCWSAFGDVHVGTVGGCGPADWQTALFEWSADCNGDGIVDFGQILSGQLVDANSNGVPDTCEAPPCPADVNDNGQVNGVDLAAVLGAWGTNGQSEGDADINNDGIVNGQDLAFVLGSWGPCSTVPAWATVIEFLPDPAVVFDPALRAAITATGLPWRVRDTATQIELVLIPPGTFNMGCTASNVYGCEADENPVHAVTLTEPFYMGRYEVTQAQWTARMGFNPSQFQSASAQVPANEVPNRPVDQVSWNTIQGFLSATGMRLPTEAEWEWAYRAGTSTAFHSMPGYPNGTNDDSLVGSIAWWGSCCGGNSGYQTRPVGGKAGNGFGLHDMSGNAWEWVNDWSGTYPSTAQTNPIGPESGSVRVMRGGSWNAGTHHLSSSDRNGVTPESGNSGEFGFRVVRNP